VELTTLWFTLVAVLFIGYFVLEGFDFGVGILAPVLSEDDTDRRVVINTVGPVWDGNEVWLITAGGALFAAFPEWYATLFSGFYLPLLAILIALIVRGVAFEFRGKGDTVRWRARWDRALFWSSLLPAFLWGVAFASILRGVPLDADNEFAGSLLDLLSPYALLGGLTTLSLFLLHGAVFVSLKTDGDVRHRARALAVSSARRLEALPEVPTVAEQGFPDYELNEWNGLYGPAGLSPAMVARWHGAVGAALADPAVRTRLGALGAIPVGSSPETFAAFVTAQREVMARLVRDTRIELG